MLILEKKQLQCLKLKKGSCINSNAYFKEVILKKESKFYLFSLSSPATPRAGAKDPEEAKD